MTFLARIAVLATVLALGAVSAAPAQTPPPSSGGVSALQIGTSGVSLGVDPQQGATLGVDAGDTGGVNVGAGPQGLQLEVDPGGTGGSPGTGTPAQSTNTPAGSTPSGSTPSSGSTPATGDAPSTGDSPRSTTPGATGGGDTGTTGDTVSGSSATGAGNETSGAAGGSARARDRVDTKPAAERNSRGVAPVIDLIEKVPAALWAALLALAVIALAMWLMWIRGRRQLERNAWMDTESPEMNAVAFERLLAHEWARSDRYQRPLGLLLLELEEPTSDGGRRSLTGKYRSDAQDAITTQAREADTVAQLSPSRFAVICPEAAPGSVETLARRLEHSLEAARLYSRVGTATRLESDRGPADLVSRAAVGIDEQPTWATPAITPGVASPDAQAVPV